MTATSTFFGSEAFKTIVNPVKYMGRKGFPRQTMEEFKLTRQDNINHNFNSFHKYDYIKQNRKIANNYINF